MLPPICEICDYDFRHDLEQNPDIGALVQFKDYKSLSNGKVGHPHGLGWFCAKHITTARLLSALTKANAIKQITEKYQES